jgi:hypothetical protein
MRKKSRLEKTLSVTFLTLTLFFCTSCSYIGEKFYGSDYWRVMNEDADIALGPDKTTAQSRKIIRDVRERILDETKYKD